MACGAWASWSNSDDQQSLESLQAAVDLGCNFFDTAYAYGEGHSEKLLGQTVRANPRQASLHGDKDSPDESRVAGARGFDA